MKKIFIFGVIFFFGIFLAQTAHAQMGWGMMGGYYSNDSSSSSSNSSYTQQEQQYQKNLQNMTNALLQTQNVQAIDKLDCSKISDSEFEKIGDAWMDVRIGNEAAHEAMDNMMGGEGSESLTQAHIQMGKNYLGCSDGAYYNWMPMMFGGSGNNATGTSVGSYPMRNSGYGMMGANTWGGSALLDMVGIVGLVDLVLAGILLFKQIRK